MTTDTNGYKIAALYHFARLDDHAAMREPLASFCCERGIKGTLLLAREGINGTVAGPAGSIDELLAYLKSIPALAALEAKLSHSPDMPFHRMKVRLKKEIVTMGVPDLDPADAGTYVAPSEWNDLISDPDTIVIDTRNDYEYALGTFRNAIDPQTSSFTEFPGWVERHHNQLAGRKIAMFCTGGIRCEKSTAYLKSVGLNDVYHLRGGILKYLEEVPASESLWEGECFVFDERVAVKHGLEIGEAELCRACRYPLTQKDRESPHYVVGISCPHCIDKRSEEDRARYAERQKQVELSERRGGRKHIGS
ncbi:MAG: rhodanese-related sulfurtransferase [Rhizobiaceae bacterium]|nr:rhodanese-related sulfurtransferase [Rhizobiaceae bacterium]